MEQRPCGPPSENRAVRMAASMSMLVASACTRTPECEGLQPADARPTFPTGSWDRRTPSQPHLTLPVPRSVLHALLRRRTKTPPSCHAYRHDRCEPEALRRHQRLGGALPARAAAEDGEAARLLAEEAFAGVRQPVCRAKMRIADLGPVTAGVIAGPLKAGDSLAEAGEPVDLRCGP